MRSRQFVTIAVVSTLLIGGAAALGAASPADRASENPPAPAEADASGEAPAEDGTVGNDSRTGGADRKNGDSPGNADRVGPSGGLPEQVPDHVSEIHDRIESFLSGSIDDLGGSLSELLGGDEPAEADGSGDGVDDADHGADA